jgi:hypothetical protein
LRPFPPYVMILLSLSLLALCSPHDSSLGGQVNLKSLLPETGQAPGWIRAHEPQEYSGEELYAYIDGGAEIFQEYGFLRVVVQDYKHRSGQSITAEIFAMKDPEAAYGMYSFKKSALGQDMEWGQGIEAQLSEYYLNLWKSRYLATLTGFNEDQTTRQGLVDLGRAIAGKIPEKAAKPSLLALLPDTGVKKSGIKYYKGNLGLFNTYVFDPASVFGVQEGVKGDDDNGGMLFLLKYSPAEKSRAQFEAALKAFVKSLKYRQLRALSNDIFTMKDGEGRTVTVSLYEPYLFIAVGMETPAAESSFQTVKTKIRRL